MSLVCVIAARQSPCRRQVRDGCTPALGCSGRHAAGETDAPCALRARRLHRGPARPVRAEGGCELPYARSDLALVRCLACGARGHLLCGGEGRPAPPRPRASCANCGEGGHLATECHRVRVLNSLPVLGCGAAWRAWHSLPRASARVLPGAAPGARSNPVRPRRASAGARLCGDGAQDVTALVRNERLGARLNEYTRYSQYGPAHAADYPSSGCARRYYPGGQARVPAVEGGCALFEIGVAFAYPKRAQCKVSPFTDVHEGAEPMTCVGVGVCVAACMRSAQLVQCQCLPGSGKRRVHAM